MTEGDAKEFARYLVANGATPHETPGSHRMTIAREIRPPHILANWRTKSRKKRVSAQQRREGNCAKHLALLRQCPCVVTLRIPARDVHHLKSGPARNERGVGMRATDKWGLPLSREPHDELERISSRRELGWFKGYGIEDLVGLAEALWNAPRDVEAMTKIIVAHRSMTKRPKTGQG